MSSFFLVDFVVYFVFVGVCRLRFRAFLFALSTKGVDVDIGQCLQCLPFTFVVHRVWCIVHWVSGTGLHHVFAKMHFHTPRQPAIHIHCARMWESLNTWLPPLTPARTEMWMHPVHGHHVQSSALFSNQTKKGVPGSQCWWRAMALNLIDVFPAAMSVLWPPSFGSNM